MDNWMQYYELSPLNCELTVYKNDFDEITDTRIYYWKDLQLKDKYTLHNRYDDNVPSWNIPKITENVPLTGTPEK